MELPYTCDYSKSNQSVCRGCQTKIVKDILRVAIMLQATTFDRKVPNWYHFQCFFLEHMPQSTRDIEGFSLLQWKDQKEIENIIAEGESPYSSPGKRSLLKRDLAKINSQATVKNYSIEYTKIGRTKCDHCEVLIKKPELRIIKQASKKKMYHFNCFIKIREELEFLESGSEIQGFSDLNEEDKNLINQELPAIYETPKKKKRPSTESQPKPERSYSQEEIVSREYNEIMQKYKQDIRENLKRDEITKLLKHNGQLVSTKSENLLERASDMLTYGALLRCRICRGQLIFSSNGYKCFSSKDAWTKCNFITIDPIRNYVEIPEDMRLKHDFLYKYEYIPRKRIFLDNPKENIIIGPLRCKNICIHGFSNEETTALCQRVKNLAGRVVNEVRRSVFCVITTNEQVKLLTQIIQEAKEMNVYVVNKEFLDNIKLEASLDGIARKCSLVPWGCELNQRIPEQFRKNKPGTSYPRNIEEEENGRRIMKIKNGIGIEPDSGLDDRAHVYQIGAVIYNAVLNKCDIEHHINSFYKIQLLESDESNEYWLFRSWGRTGTKNHDSKIEPMPSLTEAKNKFKKIFKNLTGNTWENRYGFIKKANKYNYVDVSYQAKKEEIQDLNGSVAGSNLKPAVAQLMAMIFNMQAMEKLMLEYELNLETMPLGKLSRTQIRNAYNVLTEVSWTFQRKDDPEEVLYHTNKFYSYMPHNSALGNPPLLDNKEIVKKKAEMLANLLEMETAYRIIERGANGQPGNTLDAYYNQLKANIEPLEESCDEFKFITEYVHNTHGDTHRNYDLKILEIFKVARDGEAARYEQFNNLSNRRLLWHGSRTTNFAGILSQGLRIAPAEAPVTGYMFGKGIYFADMVSKSANYCCTTKEDTEGLLLLCEVALGNIDNKIRAEEVRRLPKNKHSVRGVGQTQPDPNQMKTLEDGVQVPLGKPVKADQENTNLRYNEYIVYDVNQVKIKYLLKLDFKFKY